MSDFEQWLESQDEEEASMFSSQWRIGWNAAIASMQGDAAAEIARLTKELEEARKDAERYRWLRENYHGFEMFRNSNIPHVTLDREVDSAMKG